MLDHRCPPFSTPLYSLDVFSDQFPFCFIMLLNPMSNRFISVFSLKEADGPWQVISWSWDVYQNRYRSSCSQSTISRAASVRCPLWRCTGKKAPPLLPLLPFCLNNAPG